MGEPHCPHAPFADLLLDAEATGHDLSWDDGGEHATQYSGSPGPALPPR